MKRLLSVLALLVLAGVPRVEPSALPFQPEAWAKIETAGAPTVWVVSVAGAYVATDAPSFSLDVTGADVEHGVVTLDWTSGGASVHAVISKKPDEDSENFKRRAKKFIADMKEIFPPDPPTTG